MSVKYNIFVHKTRPVLILGYIEQIQTDSSELVEIIQTGVGTYYAGQFLVFDDLESAFQRVLENVK